MIHQPVPCSVPCRDCGSIRWIAADGSISCQQCARNPPRTVQAPPADPCGTPGWRVLLLPPGAARDHPGLVDTTWDPSERIDHRSVRWHAQAVAGKFLGQLVAVEWSKGGVWHRFLWMGGTIQADALAEEKARRRT